jgi:plasmid stabilization system protein ParE
VGRVAELGSLGHFDALMSYEVIWSDDARKNFRAAFLHRNPPEQRDWFIRMIGERLTSEIAQYPRIGDAQPGERAAGELKFGVFHVHYDIQLDREVALITKIDWDETHVA